MRAFLAVLIVFASVGAEAHKKRTVRKVMLSARATSTGIAFDVAMWMRIGGHHARRTILRFDLDKSGDLNAGEAAYLGNELAPKALGGLYLIVDGQSLAPVEAQSNARLVDEQTAEVMSLLTYTLDGESVRTFQLAWRGAPVGLIYGPLKSVPVLRLSSSHRRGYGPPWSIRGCRRTTHLRRSWDRFPRL